MDCCFLLISISFIVLKLFTGLLVNFYCLVFIVSDITVCNRGTRFKYIVHFTTELFLVNNLVMHTQLIIGNYGSFTFIL